MSISHGTSSAAALVIALITPTPTGMRGSGLRRGSWTALGLTGGLLCRKETGAAPDRSVPCPKLCTALQYPVSFPPLLFLLVDWCGVFCGAVCSLYLALSRSLRSVYEGDFTNGKKDGKGVKTWGTGDVYEGEWVKVRCHCNSTVNPNPNHRSPPYGPVVPFVQGCFYLSSNNTLGSSCRDDCWIHLRIDRLTPVRSVIL